MIGKISLGINVLLIAAVAYLFSISGEKRSENGKEANLSADVVMSDDSTNHQPKHFAFVRGDSIMTRYQFVLDQQDVLIKKAKSSESKLQRQMEKAQEEYTELVNYANSGSATESEMQIAQQRIMQLEYQLQAMQSEEQNKIAMQEVEFQKDLYLRISGFMAEYSDSQGYDMIFNFEPTGQGLLYSKEAFDITSEVLQELNSRYADELLKSSEPK
jgi:Skp family chaperone for outer membrane proteins